MLFFGFLIIILTTTIVNTQVIQLQNGKILGSFNGVYYSFRGIPYAEPPIDSLRFEPPKPYKHIWGSKVRNCRLPGKSCMRWDPTTANNKNKTDFLIGEEDCLYLNVYTPNIENPQQLYPVIIYIHGGGFAQSSGDTFKENLLMQKKSMILVTFNYRLGPLGFLSTGDDVISGNMGLKDQQLAMEWVKYNIHLFNGNRDKILLLGWSAGGISVHYHLANERTKYLINSAISMSGNGFLPYALTLNPIMKTMKLARFLNCPNILDTKELRYCLKKLPAKYIVKAMGYFKSFLNHDYRVFTPVIESNKVTKPFITNLQETYFYKNFTTIPWLISYTKNDTAILTSQLLHVDANDDLDNFEIYREHFYSLTPILLNYYESYLTENEILVKTEDLRTKYKIKLIENYLLRDYKNIERMFTSEIMFKSIEETINKHQYNGQIYAYVYNNPAPYSLANIASERSDINFGSVHGDDICLILQCPHRENYKFTKTEKLISHNFMNLLKKFAETGNLSFNNSNLQVNLPTMNYMNIFEIGPRLFKRVNNSIFIYEPNLRIFKATFPLK